MTTQPKNEAKCFYCGELLDITEPGVNQWVEGWVENRNQGGGHAIRMPIRHRRWACKWCVDRGSSKAGVLQAQLFD
jgi:hypothetical protein